MKSRILLIQFLLFASFCCLSCERQLTLTEADKLLFVRATDLKRYGYEFDNFEKHESFRKRGFFDGGIEIEYEFSPPDDTEQIYLDVQITIEATPSDARTEQEAKKTAMLDTMESEGIVFEEKSEFYKYGDSSSFFILNKDGLATGYFFVMRQGNKIYTLTLSGVDFEKPKDWKELVEPKLKLLSAYNSKESW